MRDDGGEEVVDRLVAVGGDPHRVAAADQLHDDAGAGEGLAGAGRALDEQVAVLQVGHRGDHLIDGRGVGSHDRGAGLAALQLRWILAQQGTDCMVGVRIFRKRLGEARDGVAQRVGFNRLGRSQRELRWAFQCQLRRLDMQAPPILVHLHEGDRRKRIHALALRALAGLELLLRILADPDGKRILPRAGNHLDHRQPADALDVIDELLPGHVLAGEDLPPRRLVATTMEIQELHGHLAQMMLRIPGAAVLRHVPQQAGDQGFPLLQPLPARQSLWISAIVDFIRRGIRVLPPCMILRPDANQPLMQLRRRFAIILVVPFDGLQQRGIAALPPFLISHDARSSVLHIPFPPRPVERLDLLDGVARGGGNQRLRHHAIEIDEPVLAQQPVHRVFARAVQ